MLLSVALCELERVEVGPIRPGIREGRERVRRERIRRGWSQADLAKRLQRKGLEQVYASTVAKIESGDRAVRISEATGLADLFEVSVDALLGRTAQKNDAQLAARALLDAAGQASWQVNSIEATMRERLAELAVFEQQGWELGFRSACEAACDRLTDAGNALRDVLNPPEGKPFARHLRKLLIAQLQEEVAADDTQS